MIDWHCMQMMPQLPSYWQVGKAFCPGSVFWQRKHASDIPRCLSQHCATLEVQEILKSPKSPLLGKENAPPLSAWHDACLDPMASHPFPRGWALREKRTQHSAMPMLLLPAQALAARPALVRRSLFDHAAGGGCSAASPAHCQGLRWPCIALITAARAQAAICTAGKPLQHICKRWESTNSMQTTKYRKGSTRYENPRYCLSTNRSNF